MERRDFLKCMAWAGSGLVWTMAGGIPGAVPMEQAMAAEPSTLSFVQISDSHIGFNKAANPHVTDTFQQAVNRIKTLPHDFVIHTGDITHLARPEEFDTADQILRGIDTVYRVPGEHDVLSPHGRAYFKQKWYSFDVKGAHFVALTNVLNLGQNGLGHLGDEQLGWLEKDLQNVKSDTPLVVFAHMPLWALYPQWGWGTDDAARAMTALRRFGSVTVLNGHIHQLAQKVEGRITFHTAMSTAYPQPAPGKAPAPGPLQVPADKLKTLLGVREVTWQEHDHRLAIVEKPLADAASIHIRNFKFVPAEVTVAAGTTVTWTNDDEDVHMVMADGFAGSGALDTHEKFAVKLARAGTYNYYCSVHPQMRGCIIVR